MPVKVLPYKSPRKTRRAEPLQYVVKWIDGPTMYFRWFKRDASACAFLNKLINAGFKACIMTK